MFVDSERWTGCTGALADSSAMWRTRLQPTSKSQSCSTLALGIAQVRPPVESIPNPLANALSKMCGRDNLYRMATPAKLLLAVLVVGIGCLAPVLPDQSSHVTQQKTECCADINVDGSHSCPINRGANNSACGSTCTTPAVCLLLYFGNANTFIANSQLIGTISVGNAALTARAQRPPVPPPRAAFS
jgi:hypothetical protein